MVTAAEGSMGAFHEGFPCDVTEYMKLFKVPQKGVNLWG